MDIFNVLSMIGGLALFLFGMTVLGDGLSKASGGKLERILEKLTSNPLKAVLLGAGVTAVIQSSSATTVMVVGFVNSGIMTLKQAIGIIMGANIGTTATSWILSLSGISSDNFVINLLKPSAFAPILGIIGVFMIMMAKKEFRKNVGYIMVGFTVLMFGMDAMSAAVKPLADVPEFTNILLMFSNPILGMAAGAILTAVIQSSSASVGILQALCVTGAVSYGTAFPIIMGQNIGTCVTALLSAIGASKNAKRTAFVHLYFNVIGTVIFMIVFYTANAFVHFEFLNMAADAWGIAVVHSTFNVVATIILLPMSGVLEKLAILTVKDEKVVAGNDTDEEFKILDERFLETPAYATMQCKKLTCDMAKLTQEAFESAVDMVGNTQVQPELFKKVAELEDHIDKYEDHIGTYLVKLSSRDLMEKDSKVISTILHCIGEFERISDHAIDICEVIERMTQDNMSFTNKALSELEVLKKAVREIVETSFKVFYNDDCELALTVEPLEQVVDDICAEIKKRHVARLKNQECTIDSGIALYDLLNGYERIADHCSNIAVCIIEIKENGFDTHEFLNGYKRDENVIFKEKYMEYKEKYSVGEV